MRRRGRRGPKAAWLHANEYSTDVSSKAGAPQLYNLVIPILPAARVNWLLEAGSKRAVTMQRLLVWYEFLVANTDTSSGQQTPDRYKFYMMRGNLDEIGETQEWDPFAQPIVPSLRTSWDDGIDNTAAEGTDPFLWVDYVFAPFANAADGPNSLWGTSSVLSPPRGYMTANQIGALTGSIGNRVAPQGQPQLDLRVKRRFVKDQTLVFCAQFVDLGLTNDLIYYFRAAWRLLGTVR